MAYQDNNPSNDWVYVYGKGAPPLTKARCNVRLLVDERYGRFYAAAAKSEQRRAIVDEIMHTVVERNGGRFLKRQSDGTLIEVEPRVVRAHLQTMFSDKRRVAARRERTTQRLAPLPVSLQPAGEQPLAAQRPPVTPFSSVVEQQEWNRMFVRLIDFKMSLGHCLVPNRYTADSALGAWVSTQRRQYKEILTGNSKSTPMTPERAARLESIGFVWATTDPSTTESIAYSRKTSHCRRRSYGLDIKRIPATRSNSELNYLPPEVKTKEIRDNDVLCGRLGNSGYTNHYGNRRLRNLVLSKQSQFEGATHDAKKRNLGLEILHEIEGRFLEKKFRRDPKPTVWIPLGGPQITHEGGSLVERTKPTPLNKVLQDLRDAQRKPHRGMRLSGCPCGCQSRKAEILDDLDRLDMSIHHPFPDGSEPAAAGGLPRVQRTLSLIDHLPALGSLQGQLVWNGLPGEHSPSCADSDSVLASRMESIADASEKACGRDILLDDLQRLAVPIQSPFADDAGPFNLHGLSRIQIDNSMVLENMNASAQALPPQPTAAGSLQENYESGRNAGGYSSPIIELLDGYKESIGEAVEKACERNIV